jgi:hypothetical protein
MIRDFLEKLASQIYIVGKEAALSAQHSAFSRQHSAFRNCGLWLNSLNLSA